MTQTERRLFLINTLLSERGERIEIPTDEYNQKRLLRSLFNIRMPKAVTDDFLQIQDAYLQEENRRKGITDIAETLSSTPPTVRCSAVSIPVTAVSTT